MKIFQRLKSQETTDPVASVAADSSRSVRRFVTRFLKAILIITGTIIVGLIVFAVLINIPGLLTGSDLSAANSLKASCTATLESGKFWTRDAKSVNWQDGSDGMVLQSGIFLKTDSESKILLTFFDGSTITVGPDADLQIEQVNRSSEGNTTIVIKQLLGRTWSLVQKMVDKGSKYEIQTPSAKAMVRGTSFYIDVDENGSSNIQVIEGVVAVQAKSQEVLVSAGNESYVLNGMPPGKPIQLNIASSGDYQNSLPDNEQKQGQNLASGNTGRETTSGKNAQDWNSGIWLVIGILALVIAMLVITVAAIMIARKVENTDK